MTTSKSIALSIVFLLVALATSSPLFAQGRGRVPVVPSPQSQDPGRFPGFPPNAGVGQPANLPQPNENANPRALDAPAVEGQAVVAAGAPAAADQLARTPRLADRLAGLLGVESLTTEPDGFRNLGLFVATVQVSSNVEGTTFDGLKALMLEGDGMSLGQAIQAETEMNADDAADAAEEAGEQAEELIEETS
jgi:hypothetical protein